MIYSQMTPEQQQRLLLQHQQPASNTILVKNTFLHVEGDDQTGSLAQQANASRRQQSEPPQMRPLNGFQPSPVEALPKFPESPELFHRQLMPMGLGPVYETVPGAEMPNVAALSCGSRDGGPTGPFSQLQMDGANLMIMPVDTGGNNIVSAAVVPCNGGYAIPVIPCNGGFCIPAVAINGQGPGSRRCSEGMESAQASCHTDMGGFEPSAASAQSPKNGQDEDDTINDIDLTIRNNFRQCSVGNRQTSSPTSATDSTWIPSENSRQLSAVSDASWSSGQSRFAQRGRDGDRWPMTAANKELNGFDSAKPFGGHQNQMPEQVQNMLLQRPQGGVNGGFDTCRWAGMDLQTNGRLPLPPGVLQAAQSQAADTGSTPEGLPFLNAGAGQSQAQLAQLVELFGALKRNKGVQNNKGVQKLMSRNGQKASSDPMSWDAGVVTVMVRQVPRQYSQLMLLKEVNHRGFQGLYDFLYLPFDLKKGINVGYGFVSFIHPQHALEFRKAFEGKYLDSHSTNRGKPIHVHPASLQGYEANCSHFMTTKTGQKQDPQFSPLFFPQGQPVDAATASQLGGGFFAAHQAALVSQREQNVNEETLSDASPGLVFAKSTCDQADPLPQLRKPNLQKGYKGSARK